MEEDRYRASLTPLAIQDLDEIFLTLSEHFSFVESIEKIMNRIEMAVCELKEFPYAYPLVTDPLLRQKGYRRRLIENYLVFYLIDEEKMQVIVMRILHNKTNYQMYI